MRDAALRALEGRTPSERRGRRHGRLKLSTLFKALPVPPSEKLCEGAEVDGSKKSPGSPETVDSSRMFDPLGRANTAS